MEYGPVGKLNYVYSICKCDKAPQKSMDVLFFILSPSGCYYFALQKDLHRLPLQLKFFPAEGAGMSPSHLQQEFLFLTILRSKRKTNNIL